MCVYITSIWEVCAVARRTDKNADIPHTLYTAGPRACPRAAGRERGADVPWKRTRVRDGPSGAIAPVTARRGRAGRPIAGDLARSAVGARLPPADPAPAAWNGAYAVPTRIRAGNTPARAGQRHESRHRPTRWKPRPVPQCRSRAAERAANSARRLHVIARSPRVDMRRSKDSYSSLYVRPRGARWERCGGNRP